MFCGGEDEFGEALDGVRRLLGETSADRLDDVVELLNAEVWDGVCIVRSLRRWEGIRDTRYVGGVESGDWGKRPW